MGVCESKANLPQHIAQQHGIEKASEIEDAEMAKLRATNHNLLIDKAKSVIDAANDKIKSLQTRCGASQDENERLSRELGELREKQFESERIGKEYKDELQVQEETMKEYAAKMSELRQEIESVEEERKVSVAAYKENTLSIADTLYKVHGDSVGKLKYNKMSRKLVIFVEKINHLFYYDENGPKYMKIRDISIVNSGIQKQMNQCWFLVVGERRSALFVAESRITRDKWTQFMAKSLGKASLKNETQIEVSQSVTNNNREISQIEVSLSSANSANNNGFGERQSPINIITITPPEAHGAHWHEIMPLADEEFSGNALKFNYPERISGCTIMNNGHTVQINIPSSAKCKLSIYDGEFVLKQFHFHTPSEHTIDGRAFEMEMHLVHVNEKNEICVVGFIFTTHQKYNKPKLELSKSRAHLMLAAQNEEKQHNVSTCDDEESDDLETDDEWTEEEEEEEEDNKGKAVGNDFLNQFWEQLPPNKTTQDVALDTALSFDYLFETASKSMKKNIKSNEIEINMDIYEYEGSLTTPPYTEGVQWLLSKTTHFINDKQLNKLSACWGNSNNARNVQKYFGRQVSLRSKSSLRVIE